MRILLQFTSKLTLYLLLLFPSGALMAFQNGISITTSDCGQLRTQTQGGWGTSASGNNPGAYRDAHFDAAFPNGISIGCEYSITFTSSQAVQDFLPSGSTASQLTENLIDPTSYSNVLAGQLLALRLSIGFDEYDPNFGESEVNLGDMIIANGDFQGWTVNELMQEANDFFGSCNASYSASMLNSALSSINENYVDGTMDGGFLECPDDDVVEEDLYCNIELTGLNAYCNDDDTYTLEFTILGSNATFVATDANALSGNGDQVCFNDLDSLNTDSTYTFILTYAIDQAYNVMVNTVAPVNGECVDPLNAEECYLSDISGNPPVCCDFQVECPPTGQLIYACIGEIPSADTSLITFSNNCGPVNISVSESSQGSGCNSDPYYLNRTYTISDGTTVVSCTENYIAIDASPPIISCPEDETMNCSADLTPTVWATATDNCDSDVSISYADNFNGSCDSFSRVWTASDDCGNIATCTQTIFIIDETPPALTLPENATIECASSTDPIYLGFATATDYCSEVTVTYTDSEWSGTDCQAQFVRTWTATDACGNSVSGEQIIENEDSTGPLLIGVPGNDFIQCGEIPLPPEVIAVDQCQNDTVEVLFSETIYGEGCQKTIMRSWSAIDECGNSSSVSRSIFVNDNQGPVITCPENLTLTCGDSIPDPEEAGFASALDNCSGDNVTIYFEDGPLSNDCPPTVSRVWSAVDSCGNSSSCVQLIEFLDSIPPVIECVDDITVNCGMGDISPLFTGTPNIIDDCSVVSLDYTDGVLEGACPVTFTRTWVASDACGNTSICEQNITVIDELAPAIYCPNDVTIECGSSTTPENTGMASAYDNCLSASVTYSDVETGSGCTYTITRTWVATDYCGNSVSCDQLISVEDNTAPTVSCPPQVTVDCGVDVIDESITGLPVANDNCGSTVSFTYMDSEIQGDCPQFFFRVWIASDECGNSTTCSQMIQLLDTTAPELICPDDVTINCDDSIDPSFTGTASALDECSNAEVSYIDSLIQTSGSSSTDGCGQFRTQTQGGWGSVSNGNNPGSYRDANFDAAFPNGLSIGCDYTLTLTSSLAVQNFLPAGGTSAPLYIDMVNPVGFGNTLAAQLTALTLSLGFDANDPSFSEAETSLGSLIISTGEFAGWTVQELVDEANQFIGQCESDFEASRLNEALSRINENFVDGRMDNGYLICNEESENCFTIYRTWTAIDACGNETSCVQVITAGSNVNTLMPDHIDQLNAYPSPTNGNVFVSAFDQMKSGDRIEVFTVSGFSILSTQITEDGQQLIDLSNMESGTYIIQWIGQSGSASAMVIKN